jgi:hypothetical protein
MLPEQANDEPAAAGRHGSNPQVRFARSRINYPRKPLWGRMTSCARLLTAQFYEISRSTITTSRH